MKNKKRLYLVLMFLFACLLAVGIPADAQAKKKKKVKTPSLSKAKITLSKTSYTYNGKERKPKVTVKVSVKGKKKKKLAKKFYTVKYADNKSAGKAKVTVKANSTGKKKKKCKGKKSAAFVINKATRSIVPGKTTYSAVEDDSAFNITAKASKGKGTITYVSSNSSVASITSAGRVTPKKAGRADVTATVKEVKNYKAATVKIPVTINKIPTFNIDSAASIRNFNYEKRKDNWYTEMGYEGIVDFTPTFLTAYKWNVTKYNMPGLAPTGRADVFAGSVECKDLCPQGVCTAGDYLLVTAYCTDNVHNSCILIYSKSSGAFLNSLVLKKKSHVGGITYDGTNVWVCHSNTTSLQRISYSGLKKCATGSKKVVKITDVKLPAEEDGENPLKGKPSAVAYQGNGGYDEEGEYLWVASNATPNSQSSDEASEETDDESEEPLMIAYRYENGKLNTVPRYLYGKVHDYLGISSIDTDEKQQESMAVSGVAVTVSGAAVTEVVKDGPATSILTAEGEKVSLQQGDIVVKIGETDISSQAVFENAVDKVKDGEKLYIRALRIQDGKVEVIEGTITVKVGERQTQSGEDAYLKVVIPYRVQGLTFTDGGKVIFSISNGRSTEKPRYISQLLVTDMDASCTLIYRDLIILPPMIEGIEMQKNGELYMLFESASIKYYSGTDKKGKSECPIDRIISVDLNLD